MPTDEVGLDELIVARQYNACEALVIAGARAVSHKGLARLIKNAPTAASKLVKEGVRPEIRVVYVSGAGTDRLNGVYVPDGEAWGRQKFVQLDEPPPGQAMSRRALALTVTF